MSSAHLEEQKEILEKIRRILIDNIESDYVSVELYEEIFEKSDKCTMHYFNTKGEKNNIKLDGLTNLEMMDLAFSLKELMKNEDNISWNSFNFIYTKGGAVEINYNYGPINPRL